MDGSYVLGEGNFAVVIGPFQYNDVNKSDFFHKQLRQTRTMSFVIKIYKKQPTDTHEQLIKKQQLYTQLAKTSRHKSILFPVATSFVRGKDIISVFPYMKQYLDKRYLYQLELEEYGGASVETFIYNRKKPIFSMEQFLKIWRCVPNILEDSYHVLFDNHLVMTDIKTSNMVLSPDYVLRLIDVDINPNKRTLRINTPYIENLPPQYFNREWWHPLDQNNRKYLLEMYKKNEQKYLRNEKRMIFSIIKFIHKYKDFYSFIQQGEPLSLQDRRFQRLFFVMYPLLMVILKMVVYQCARPQTPDEIAHMKKIVAFCLDILQKRGHFSDKFNYRTFQHFLWTMKTI